MATDIIILALALGFLGLMFGVFVGLWMNPSFKAKAMRVITKKDYGILAIVSKDKRSIRRSVINFQNDIITTSNGVYIIEQNRIYRESALHKGFMLTKGTREIKWEGGIPIVFISEDDIKPLDFFDDPAKSNPKQSASVILSWITNQIAKGFSSMKRQEILLYLIILVVIINAAISYLTLDAVGQLQAKNAAPAAAAPSGSVSAPIIPQGGQLDGDKIVIQPQGGG